MAYPKDMKLSELTNGMQIRFADTNLIGFSFKEDEEWIINSAFKRY